jgi:hypothetical protein
MVSFLLFFITIYIFLSCFVWNRTLLERLKFLSISCGGRRLSAPWKTFKLPGKLISCPHLLLELLVYWKSAQPKSTLISVWNKKLVFTFLHSPCDHLGCRWGNFIKIEITFSISGMANRIRHSIKYEREWSNREQSRPASRRISWLKISASKWPRKSKPVK